MQLYIVDAFTDKLFSGNPAGVCVLENWPADTLMQQIAFENNLAETAFVVKKTGNYHIRWFTPAVEVDLCGHATLASAHVLFNHKYIQDDSISFQSRSGLLTVTRNNEQLTLNFPVDTLETVIPTRDLLACFDIRPKEILKGKTDYLFVFEHKDDIVNIKPDLHQIKQTGGRGIIVTAPGKTVDFVSRFFAPQAGIDEDPVTGSAHTTLIPYWSKKLNKNAFSALQLSQRGGKLWCELLDDRVLISGQAVTYLIGDIQLNTN